MSFLGCNIFVVSQFFSGLFTETERKTIAAHRKEIMNKKVLKICIVISISVSIFSHSSSLILFGKKLVKKKFKKIIFLGIKIRGCDGFNKIEEG